MLMNKSAGSHNFSTFRMVYYGYDANRAAGQPWLTRQDFYLRCANDEDFKASWAPFLDLEYIEDEELRELAPLTSSPLA